MSGRPWQGDVPRGHHSATIMEPVRKWHGLPHQQWSKAITIRRRSPDLHFWASLQEGEGRPRKGQLHAGKQRQIPGDGDEPPRRVEINNASLGVIEDHVIANMDHIKLLEVTTDNDINFSKHIGEACTKAGRKVGVLTRLRNNWSPAPQNSTSTRHQSCRSLPSATRSGTSVRPPIQERSSESKNEH